MHPSSWCKDCTKRKERDRVARQPMEQRKEKWLRHKYGITFTDFKNIYDKQDGVCCICSRKLIIFEDASSTHKACLDHCHTTGVIRGILCNHCNRALGLFEDDIDSLKEAIVYLNRSAIL
jgi:hypothetical protein